MSHTILEGFDFISGFVPVDLQTDANDGDWVSFKNYERIGVLFFKAAGTAGDDPTLTIEQATAVAGTSNKALDFTTIYTKQGTLTSVGEWTKVTQSAANTYTDATSAEVQAMWFVEFKAQELDVNNGFDCLQAKVADVGGNAQVGALLYVGVPKLMGAPENRASGIID